VPTFPPGTVEGEIDGGGTRWTVKLANLVGSVTEVALTVTVLAAAMLAGALYVTVVAVAADKVPEPVAGITDHVTPAVFGSLVTEAVMDSVPLCSSVTGAAGDVMATTIAALIVMLRGPLVVLKPRESVTFTVKDKVPAAVGVPLMTPVPELIVRGAIAPAGTTTYV
jgi:hypothetical protein